MYSVNVLNCRPTCMPEGLHHDSVVNFTFNPSIAKFLGVGVVISRNETQILQLMSKFQGKYIRNKINGKIFLKKTKKAGKNE